MGNVHIAVLPTGPCLVTDKINVSPEALQSCSWKVEGLFKHSQSILPPRHHSNSRELRLCAHQTAASMLTSTDTKATYGDALKPGDCQHEGFKGHALISCVVLLPAITLALLLLLAQHEA
jgi:hypothetical protein